MFFPKESLRKIIQGDISDDPETLARASADASIFKIKPEVVVYPKHVADVKSLVKFATEEQKKGNNISLTARSGGTDMGGGPLSESIVVDFTRYFNHVKEVGDGYAVTEPGVYYRDFEKETLKKNLLFPSYPASREICTVGGIVANNAGGEKSLQFGKTENFIKALKVVLADGEEYECKPITRDEWEQKKKQNNFEGEVYRKMFDLMSVHYDALRKAKPSVSKNSSGYNLWDAYDREKGVFDMTKIFVGSQGTLGCITEITFSLVHPKAHSRLLVMYLPDIHNLPELTNHVLDFKPESFESFDDHTFAIALKVLPRLIKKMKGKILPLGFSFIPDFWAIFAGGLPKLVLFAEFTGDTPEEAQEKADHALKDIKNFKVKAFVTHSNEEGSKYWVMRRESFNMLREHIRGKRTIPFIDDLVVHPREMAEFLPKLNELLLPYGKDITYTIAGHVGDGNFHIIPLVDIRNPRTKEIIKTLGHKVYDLVFQYKGSMSGEHNDGLIRGPYLRQMYGEEIVTLFEETKRVFDPHNIFNPGKKTQATFEMAQKYITL